MKQIFAISAFVLSLPGAALAATRTYDVGAFEAVSVAAGVEADITMGSTRSVTAENQAGDFDDLRILNEGNVLRIERTPVKGIFTWFSKRANYKVHVVTPTLRTLTASSGSEVSIKGRIEGDFSVSASSGSEVSVQQINGGNVKASATSGSDMEISGTCVSLEIGASSGSDLDAKGLACENVTVRASSGSDVSVNATKRITGNASSGSDVSVRGKPAVMQVEESSGADVTVAD